MSKSIQELLDAVQPERLIPFRNLHETIVRNLPIGFEPGLSYGGLGYVVPHTLYPAGYHCKPTEPLPFAGIASQKNSINFYHMGIYADPALLDWFLAEYPRHSSQRLDMGKSCIRFKKIHEIPLDLIGELITKMTVAQWIQLYEAQILK